MSDERMGEEKQFQIEGYLFVSDGWEHGPSVMLRANDWNQAHYEALAIRSRCDNCFISYFSSREVTGKDEAWAGLVDWPFEPGKRYRVVITEVE